jgi:copper ion binding protein
MNNQTLKKEDYRVEGMTCSGCERAVQKVVTSLEGVTTAKAEVASSSVSVEYDPSRVSSEKIKNAVNGLGYRVVE